MPICSNEKCDDAVFIKKWRLCKTHYFAAYNAGEIPARKPKVQKPPVDRSSSCERCGSRFEVNRLGQKYCSRDCRVRANNEAHRGESGLRYEPRASACKQCGAVSYKQKRSYCSDECKAKAASERLARRCSIEGCESGIRARGLCGLHYQEARAAAGEICSVGGCVDAKHCQGLCPKHYAAANERAVRSKESRAEESQRRRARERAARVAPVNRAAIFERDGFTCQICMESIDMAATAPHPRSPSIDHIVPLARGGVHGPENVQAAHLGCNTRKGANLSLLAA